jgi:transcription antitermination factor NusG
VSSEARFPWFAVRVKPRWEKEVARNLIRLGCSALLPLYIRETQWSDRIKKVELPLFPGYLFASFDPRRPLLVKATPGVLSIVSSGRELVPLAQSEVEAIQVLMHAGLPREPWEYPESGDVVRMISGPLAGVRGVVCSEGGVDRLVLSISLFRRAVAVRVERKWLDTSRKPIMNVMPPEVHSLAVAHENCS